MRFSLKNITIQLANPEHRLPLPGQIGLFLTGNARISVNPLDPFWAALLRDQSVLPASVEKPVALEKGSR
jgi:hypothetical protein